MNQGKGQQAKPPTVAGVNYLNFTTAEADEPHSYFAGSRKLPASWIMNPIVTMTAPASSSGKGGKGGGGGKGGKGGGGSASNYYGHAAAVLCQGQLDYFWGVLINNDLVYPPALNWNTQIYQSGRTTIWTDGNVYKTFAQTDQDPPNSPWALYATPWTAGTYAIGIVKLYMGNVWIVTGAPATVAPPATIPAFSILPIFPPVISSNWKYVCTPDIWSVTNTFWQTGSVVAWAGQVWITPSGTKAQPPASPWRVWQIGRAGSPNPLKFTVPNMGDAYLYWGTENQTLDTVNENVLAPLGHPPYRNKAVIVFKNFLFGTEQQTPPDVIVLADRTPVQSLITGASTTPDSDMQINPWCILAELLTHPVIGLGLSNTFFDQTSWQAEADRCGANTELYYISPIFTSLKQVRDLVSDILGYPDAFIFWSAVASLTAGHWPHGDAAPVFDSTNTINRNNLTEEISYDTAGWGQTYNSIELSFQDIQSGFADRPVIASNLFNMAAVRRTQIQKVSRPYITRFVQATAWAAECAKLAGDQIISGELTVQAEKATAIKTGSSFLLTDDVTGVSLTMRCTERTVMASPAGLVKLKYETERGLAPQAYSPSPVNPPIPVGLSPSPLLNATLFPLPSSLGTGPNEICVLAGRDSNVTTSFDVWFRSADTTSFQNIGNVSSFACLGTPDGQTPAGFDLTNTFNYNPASPTVQINNSGNPTADVWNVTVSSGGSPLVLGVDYTYNTAVGQVTILATTSMSSGTAFQITAEWLIPFLQGPEPSEDWESISYTPTQDEITDGAILLIAIQGANTALFEIMSVKSIQTLTSPYLGAEVRRGMFGTVYGGDGVYEWGTNPNDIYCIINKSNLIGAELSHTSFPTLQQTGGSGLFILSPRSAFITADPSDLYDPAINPSGLSTEYSYDFINSYAPTITVNQLFRNGGAVASFTSSTILTTDVLQISITASDLNADMTSISITAVNGSMTRSLLTEVFPQSGGLSRTVQFSLTTIGNYDIMLAAVDAEGNSTSLDLTGGVPIVVDTSSSPTTAPTAKITSWSASPNNTNPITIQYVQLGYFSSVVTLTYQWFNRTTGIGYGSPATIIAGTNVAGFGHLTGNILQPSLAKAENLILYVTTTPVSGQTMFGLANSATVRFYFPK